MLVERGEVIRQRLDCSSVIAWLELEVQIMEPLPGIVQLFFVLGQGK
jgi:hypothetical protein